MRSFANIKLLFDAIRSFINSCRSKLNTCISVRATESLLNAEEARQTKGKNKIVRSSSLRELAQEVYYELSRFTLSSISFTYLSFSVFLSFSSLFSLIFDPSLPRLHPLYCSQLSRCVLQRCLMHAMNKAPLSGTRHNAASRFTRNSGNTRTRIYLCLVTCLLTETVILLSINCVIQRRPT